MAIEFHCANCNRRMRAPEASAGKKGRCPHCKAVTEIPSQSVPRQPQEPQHELMADFAAPDAGAGADDLFDDLPSFRPPAGAANPFADRPDQGVQEISPYSPPKSAPSSSDDTLMRMLLPVGRSPYAIVAGYLGLLSLLCCLLGPIAVIVGIVAIIDLQKKPELGGMGRAVTGIVLGSLATLFFFLSLFSLVLDG